MIYQVSAQSITLCECHIQIHFLDKIVSCKATVINICPNPFKLHMIVVLPTIITFDNILGPLPSNFTTSSCPSLLQQTFPELSNQPEAPFIEPSPQEGPRTHGLHTGQGWPRLVTVHALVHTVSALLACQCACSADSGRVRNVVLLRAFSLCSFF